MASSRISSPRGMSSSSPRSCPGLAKTSACRPSFTRSGSSRLASTFLRPSLPPRPTRPSPRSRPRCRPSPRRLPATRACRPSDYRDVIKALKKEQLVGDGDPDALSGPAQADRGDHPGQADPDVAGACRPASGSPPRPRARPRRRPTCIRPGCWAIRARSASLSSRSTSPTSRGRCRSSTTSISRPPRGH